MWQNSFSCTWVKSKMWFLRLGLEHNKIPSYLNGKKKCFEEAFNALKLLTFNIRSMRNIVTGVLRICQGHLRILWPSLIKCIGYTCRLNSESYSYNHLLILYLSIFYICVACFRHSTSLGTYLREPEMSWRKYFSFCWLKVLFVHFLENILSFYRNHAIHW